jgi:hypothetical protein
MAKRITAEETAFLAKGQERRRKLYRQIDAVSRSIEELEKKALAIVKASGKRRCTRHGYEFELVKGSPYVNWKNAFIGECGADEAEKLQAAAPIPERVRLLPLDR